jgi:hypothetical protein
MTLPSIPDPPGLAEELSEIIADLTSLEALVYANPEHLTEPQLRQLRQDLSDIRARVRRHLQ